AFPCDRPRHRKGPRFEHRDLKVLPTHIPIESKGAAQDSRIEVDIGRRGLELVGSQDDPFLAQRELLACEIEDEPPIPRVDQRLHAALRQPPRPSAWPSAPPAARSAPAPPVAPRVASRTRPAKGAAPRSGRSGS